MSSAIHDVGVSHSNATFLYLLTHGVYGLCVVRGSLTRAPVSAQRYGLLACGALARAFQDGHTGDNFNIITLAVDLEYKMKYLV